MSEKNMAQETIAMPKQKGAVVAKAAAVAVMALLLAVTVLSVMISLVKYSPRGGVASSPFVGLSNYQRLLSLQNFVNTPVNSVLHKLAQMLGGLIVGLPLTMLVCLPRKRPGRVLTLAALCLIPAFLPQISLYHLIMTVVPRQVLISEDASYGLLMMVTCLQTGGFMAFCGGLFSYLHRRGVGNGAWQGLLVALLIQELSILTPDGSAMYLLSNSINAKTTTTLDLYIYQYGLMNAQYSISAAASVLKVLAQSLLAIVPAVALCRIARVDTTRIDLPRAKGSTLAVMMSPLLWMVALAAAAVGIMSCLTVQGTSDEWMAAFSNAVISTESLSPNILSSVAIASLGGLLAAVAGYGLIAMYKDGGKTFGLMMVMLSSSLSCLISEYILMRNLGAINTIVAPILRVTFDPRFVALVLVTALVLRMAPERPTKGLGLGLFFAAAACAWGDFISSNIYLMRASLQSLAAVCRQLLLSTPVSSDSAINNQQLLDAEATKIVVLALVALPAVLLGLAAACQFIRCFREAKPAEQPQAEDASAALAEQPQAEDASATPTEQPQAEEAATPAETPVEIPAQAPMAEAAPAEQAAEAAV